MSFCLGDKVLCIKDIDFGTYVIKKGGVYTIRGAQDSSLNPDWICFRELPIINIYNWKARFISLKYATAYDKAIYGITP
jgi:hypothetical protein